MVQFWIADSIYCNYAVECNPVMERNSLFKTFYHENMTHSNVQIYSRSIMTEISKMLFSFQKCSPLFFLRTFFMKIFHLVLCDNDFILVFFVWNFNLEIKNIFFSKTQLLSEDSDFILEDG